LSNVKGLKEEKKYIMERIVYPSIYKDKFESYGLKTIRGAILYGPSGCGKTFIASAIFNEMAKLRDKSGVTLKDKTNRKGFFVINGPQVLSKWSGQTEFTIRKIFNEARNAAKQSGFPSIIFWDEIESIAGRRKDVDTYSPEKTIIPTLLSELHGVNTNNDVILIGATNMPSLIDPALMRPGRLGDLILEIPRPDKEASFDILKQCLSKKKMPESIEKLLENKIVENIVDYIFDNENPIAWTKKDLSVTALFRKNMVNGALFTHIGEEIIRKVCLSEIEGTSVATEKEILEMVDHTMLSQIGALDKGIKCGFDFDVTDLVLDASFGS
jgi:SpoVK/Ycf46/Vps4 family AAA+-type ATPase